MISAMITAASVALSAWAGYPRPLPVSLSPEVQEPAGGYWYGIGVVESTGHQVRLDCRVQDQQVEKRTAPGTFETRTALVCRDAVMPPMMRW